MDQKQAPKASASKTSFRPSKSRKSESESLVVRTDARGRIQLPKRFLTTEFFELVPQESSLILFPLSVERVETNKNLQKAEIWLNEEVSTFVRADFARAVQAMAMQAKARGIDAIILFGSRARGDALTSSDFDIALFSSEALSRSQREEWSEWIEQVLSKEINLLRTHGVRGDLSFSYFSSREIPASPPGILFSIAQEGLVLWQKERVFEDWRKRVLRIIKKMDAKLKVSGKLRTWHWKK